MGSNLMLSFARQWSPDRIIGTLQTVFAPLQTTAVATNDYDLRLVHFINRVVCPKTIENDTLPKGHAFIPESGIQSQNNAGERSSHLEGQPLRASGYRVQKMEKYSTTLAFNGWR
jgi:hypothetical protein